jgi:hypothetical protein
VPGPLVVPVAPVAPEFGLDEGVVEGGVEGVVLDVLPIEPVVDEPEPVVPVAPIEDVEPGVELVPLAVVSVLLLVLPVVVDVLGDVLPLKLPEPVVEPVVVEGVVLLLLDDVPVEPVPLEPVVGLSAPRLHAASENAAAMASATAVNLVFIRNSLFGVKVARAAATALK